MPCDAKNSLRGAGDPTSLTHWFLAGTLESKVPGGACLQEAGGIYFGGGNVVVSVRRGYELRPNDAFAIAEAAFLVGTGTPKKADVIQIAEDGTTARIGEMDVVSVDLGERVELQARSFRAATPQPYVAPEEGGPTEEAVGGMIDYIATMFDGGKTEEACKILGAAESVARSTPKAKARAVALRSANCPGTK